MQTFLQGIAKKAREQPQHRFGNLYELLNETFLHECWHDIRKDAAYGVDRVSAEDYEQHLDENIHHLVERLKQKHAKGAEPNSSDGSTSQKARDGFAR
jgi:hypothetical protein